MASETIDVDACDDNIGRPQRPVKRPTPSPILISDDEVEMVEVTAKLTSRSTRASARSYSVDSDIKIVQQTTPGPDVIDLVSDDEIKEPKISKPSAAKIARRHTSTLDVKPRAETSTSRITNSRRDSARAGISATSVDIKPVVNDPGPSRKIIYKGPKSSIVQHTRGKNEHIGTPKPLLPPHPMEEIDSEDEYEHTATFNPFRHPTESPSDDRRFEAPVDPPLDLVEPQPSKKRRYVDISSQLPPTAILSSTDGPFIWDVLRKLNILPHFRPMPRCLSRKRPRLAEALDMDHYRRSCHFQRAGGAINKILQHNGRVVICSNTAGGNIAGETDPYNKPGTLISWSKRDPSKILDLEQGNPENLYGTHYSVHCIAYDPVGNILASSGADNNVRTWTFDDSDDIDKCNEPYIESQSYEYKVKSKASAPHDLAFKPGASILAIGEQRLTVENITEDTRHTFDLVDEKERASHVAGAIAWGCEASSSMIFALSEPVVQNDHGGHHVAVDVDALTPAFNFDATEAGDALCVNPTGTTVALVTNSGSDSFVRIYDVGRRSGAAIQTRCLEPFESEDHEVNSMAFSSDSIYLAIGRDDNCTHVYDSRMLERGILYDFQHTGTRFSSRDESFFGVVGVEWVESRFNRLGLITGGNDGCVRLWDPLRANAGGIVLAQADSDVAYFSLGDPFKGEHGLVVGDSAGAVYVMDGHPDI